MELHAVDENITFAAALTQFKCVTQIWGPAQDGMKSFLRQHFQEL